MEDGFVRKDIGGGTYWLEPQTRTLSDGFSREAWLENIAEPLMTDFSRAHSWPLSLTMPSQTDMVVLVRTDHLTPLKFSPIPVGHRVSMIQSSAGLIYLASIPAERCNLLLDLLSRMQPLKDSPHIGRDKRALAHLKNIRQQGYCLIESTPKVSSLSLPIRLRHSIIACISLRIFTTAMTKPQIKSNFFPRLRELATDISGAISLAQPFD